MTARVAIVGGGPSGLMIANLLAADGQEVEVFEGSDAIGGLCRSRVTDGYVFDLAGGHIMYTKDPRVAALWEGLFTDDPLVVTRRDARIMHERGLFTSYPFENALGELPLEHNLECTEGVIRAHLARVRTPEPGNFHDWVQWKMGAGVAKHFMEPYNRKIWKADLREMSTDWIAGRVPDAPLEDVLKASLGHTTEGYTHQSVFRYPRHGGFAAIHERIAAPVRDRIHLGRRVERIERANGRAGGGGGGGGGGSGWKVDGEHYDHVVCTAPLHKLPELMPGMERGAAEAARGLRYRGVASYLFGIEQPWVRPYCWVYLPHGWQGPANRITYLSNYSPNNAPDGKGSILAEVTYEPGREPDVSDAGRRALARALHQAGLLDAERIQAWDAALNPLAYILYDTGFAARRKTVLDHVDALEGFHALGRFGRYEYHNSDQCLSQALDLAERLLPVLRRGGGPA